MWSRLSQFARDLAERAGKTAVQAAVITIGAGLTSDEFAEVVPIQYRVFVIPVVAAGISSFTSWVSRWPGSHDTAALGS